MAKDAARSRTYTQLNLNRVALPQRLSNRRADCLWRSAFLLFLGAQPTPRRRGKTRNRACFREPEEALMSRIRRFNWTCTSRPSTLILHREATILTKTESWDRILTAFKEKFRLIYRARMISAAMPGAGALQTKGVNSDGQGEGIYRND